MLNQLRELFSSLLFIVFLLPCSLAISMVPDENQLQPVAEFELPNVDGGRVSLKPGRPTIIFFLGTECPLVKLYSRRIQKIAKDAGASVRLIGISSNRQDSIDDLKKFVAQQEIQFEIAKDYDNKIANQLGATRTPEVLLLDQDLRIVYRGRVDDQYSPGISRSKPERYFLKTALNQMLAKKEIANPKTEPVGCLIGKVKTPVKSSSVTYCDQIVRLLNKHCIECHRPNEIGPFELTEYEEVVGWSDMMLEVIEQNRMPPWHANPEHGDFLNARGMSEKEKRLMAEWVNNGAPYGDHKKLPPTPEFIRGWNLSQPPDKIVEMSEPYTVPADGVVEYQYFVVDPEFKEDKWIRAAQVLPGNRSVVHHSIVFVRPPDGTPFRGIGWLSAYVPGQRSFLLPQTHARLVPAGSKLVFQQHYTPNGSVQKDRTKIGLVFAKKEVATEVYTVAGLNQEFEIPPMKSDVKVQSKVRSLPKKGQLLAITPHMHFRGKSFRASALKDGKLQTICDIPAYDFNWQHTYIYKKPLDLDSIDQLEMTTIFDNSPRNPFNPDPSQMVTWGDQTFEEMSVAFFDVAVPRKMASENGSKSNSASSDSRDATSNLDPRTKPSVNSVADKQFADEFFDRWDRNRNNRVERTEVSIAMRGFGFNQYDRNRDGVLTREEVAAFAARKKIKTNR